MTQFDALKILKTGVSVFLTGAPGSGKTHTINQYIKYLRDREVDVAAGSKIGAGVIRIRNYPDYATNANFTCSSLVEAICVIVDI